MKLVIPRTNLGAAAILLCGSAMVATGGPSTEAQGAPWLAPAADEHVTAQWVQDVAHELRRERNRNVLINVPSGHPQAAILGYLNDAADALEAGQERSAKDLVRRALGILEDGVQYGWLSESDIKPIRRTILASFNRAMRDVPREAKSKGDQGEDLALSRKAERWTGYTQNRPLGLTERLDVDRRARPGNPRGQALDEGKSNDRDRRLDSEKSRGGETQAREERGGTARYYTDDFYYPDDAIRPSRQGQGDNYREETDPRISQDRAQHQRGRDRFYQEGEQANEGSYDGEQQRGDRG